MNDALGDRMKMYEMAEAGRRLLPLLPAVARIDGRSFSSFTRGLRRPYDERLSHLMVDTVKYLVQETNAVCGYAQSDEITLVWYSPTLATQIFFDGRIQKMVSVLAGMTSSYFLYRLAVDRVLPPEYAARLPHFDCRVWSLPTLEEAANCLLWREWDATKNSISMAAQEHYSDRELLGKNSSEKQEMLFQKGVNWNDFPDLFKRGTFVQRRKVLRKFTTEEMDKLPPKHAARTNPDLVVERSEVAVIPMPPFTRVVNRVGVIFRGEEPRTEAVSDQAN
jgi:tRNA(His) 5'-end guanylyltransferase